MSAAANERLLVFVGSYAEPDGQGVYTYAFDEQTDALTLLDSVGGLKNPTFLSVDTAGRKVYAIAEAPDKSGEAAAFAFDAESGKLTELNRGRTVGASTCHITRSPSGKHLIVSSYHGGSIGLVAIEEDGTVGPLRDTKQHEGRGAHPERQDRPHAHSAFYSPDGRYLLVQDLGIDRIKVYTVDEAAGKLELHGEAATHPGAGPRHLAFHPNGRYAFVINEVDSTVTSLRYDAAEGRLTEVQTVPTLPDGFAGENTCAEIAVSSDGRFVYGSNRGHDSLVVYSVDADNGNLTLVQHISTEGGHPRHFALTPSGRRLIAANRDSNNLVIFHVDRETGKLTYSGKQVQASKPVCVQPVFITG